jgi:hypothetical protein
MVLVDLPRLEKRGFTPGAVRVAEGLLVLVPNDPSALEVLQ